MSLWRNRTIWLPDRRSCDRLFITTARGAARFILRGGSVRARKPSPGPGEEGHGVVEGRPPAGKLVGVQRRTYRHRSAGAQAKVPALRGTPGLGCAVDLGVRHEPAA